MQTTKTIYLAADTQEGCLVASEEFTHWADALLAAMTDGAATFCRDADGYMHAEENGKQVFSCGSAKSDDDAAKNQCGRELAREAKGRYTWIEIEVDGAGFLVSSDENKLLDAVTYGRAAGYSLRNADAARAGVEGDEE